MTDARAFEHCEKCGYMVRNGQGCSCAPAIPQGIKRIYGLTMYLIDSPVPVFLDNVEHIQTEGGLLRLIIDGQSRWWPLCNVSVIVENSVRTV